MRLYTLDDLPLRAQPGVRLSPTSSYVLQNAHVSLAELLPTSITTDRSTSELSNRKFKQLDILRSIRRKMIDNEYDLHHIKTASRPKHQNDDTRHRDYQDSQNRLQRKRGSKYSKAGKKSSKSAPKDIQPRLFRAKRNEGRPEVVRQKSLKAFQLKRPKKQSDVQKEVQTTKIRYSKELMKQIDLERLRQEARRTEISNLEGIEARRLEKIHMIERLEAQKKLDALKLAQESAVGQMAMRQSFC